MRIRVSIGDGVRFGIGLLLANVVVAAIALAIFVFFPIVAGNILQAFADAKPSR